MDFNLNTIIQGDPVNAVIKVFTIIFLIIFILYSLLTIREVSIMNHSLETRLSIEIYLIAWFQLFLGIIALFTVLLFS
jgi:uncharacterized MnhB-related membrane protein